LRLGACDVRALKSFFGKSVFCACIVIIIFIIVIMSGNQKHKTERDTMPDTEKKLTCKRCGWQWVARTDKPKCCPGCKSSRWAEPKREAK
jgi:hypothetical protein